MKTSIDSLDIICELVISIAKTDDNSVLVNSVDCCNDGNTFVIYNSKYLLSQLLRELKIDDNKCHISEKAADEINKYKFDKYSIDEYLYNANYTIWKRKGNKPFKFNKNFTVEHIVPISNIIDRLVYEYNKENHLEYNQILNILNDIHICIITKKEDKKLDSKGYRIKRDGDYKTIIGKGAYKQCGISISKDTTIKSIRKLYTGGK